MTAVSFAPEASAAASDLPRILVVEDDEGLCNLIVKALRKGGYNVSCATTGNDALANIQQTQPAAILLDQKLPDMTGKELMSILNERKCETPFIVMTGQGSESLAVEMMKLGAFDYMIKGFDLLDLLPVAFRRLFRELETKKRLRMAEEALKRNALRYQSIIAVSNTGAWEYNGQTGELWCSQEYFAMLGYELSDYTGPSGHCQQDVWLELIHPDDRDRALMAFNSYLAGGSSGMYEQQYRMRHKNGTWVKVWARGRTLRNEDGSLTNQTVGTHIDITEHEQLEERLRQSEKMDAIGQLAGGIAHDFNNQLGGIMGYADLLFQSAPNCELRTYAERILTATQRAAELTSQLLAFARKGKNLIAPVNLHAVISDTAAMLQRSIDKKIEIRLHLDAKSCVVSGDQTQLQNALLNLAINARDAMPNGGVLDISTNDSQLKKDAFGFEIATGNYIKLDVCDTGCGMSDEVLRHLFEPFFTTKEPGKGTGLGLPSVFGTVKGHHGAIICTSEQDKGTVFTLYLPLQEEHADSSASTQIDRTQQAIHARVLVIDDELLLVNMLREILHGLGCDVFAFCNPREGLAYFTTSSPEIDLVILDLIMPGINGQELFQEMQKIKPSVKVLISSGFGMNGEVQALLNLGAKGFLHKPYRLAELHQKITESLSSKKSGSEIQNE